MLYEKNLDGFYLDGCAVPQICTNTAHGCGYYNESLGQVVGTSPILATRDYMKTLYMATKIGPGAGRKWILAHTSGSIFLPCLSFADAYLDGENIGNVYSKDKFRAEFMGHPFGIPAYFLGETTKDAAWALVHGMSCGHLGHMRDSWATYQALGSSSGTWVPYWKSNHPINNSAGLTISCYVRNGINTYAIVANLTENNIANATLYINWALLGLGSGSKVRTAYGHEISTYPNNPVVSINAGEFLLLRIEPY
jgi:hypothetical protein